MTTGSAPRADLAWGKDNARPARGAGGGGLRSGTHRTPGLGPLLSFAPNPQKRMA